jgi:hypothetical protein
MTVNPAFIGNAGQPGLHRQIRLTRAFIGAAG